MPFTSLGLSEPILKAIAETGYDTPTPIQAQAIPVVLAGRDVMAAAQTGTGKTAGFTLPLLEMLSKGTSARPNGVRALILTPTRELAAQVFDCVQAYSKYLPLKSAIVHGGVNIHPQIAKLRRGVNILVATPGRLLDLVNQRVLNLSTVEIVVLDESDRMLDMGFLPDIRRIFKLLPERRQNLLFSATFSKEIKELADKLLRSPKLIEVARRNTAAERIIHIVHPVDRERKRELLSFLIGSKNWQQVLVFTRTKHGANRLSQQLESDGLSSTAIHGNKSQAARTRALMQFKQGKARVLVATDVAARGLDIEKLPYVVNFELPSTPKDYVHRVGRTGRASNEGMAISLVSADELKLLREIEKLLQTKMPQEVIPGHEPNSRIKAGPAFITQHARTGQRRKNYKKQMQR